MPGEARTRSAPRATASHAGSGLRRALRPSPLPARRGCRCAAKPQPSRRASDAGTRISSRHSADVCCAFVPSLRSILPRLKPALRCLRARPSRGRPRDPSETELNDACVRAGAILHKGRRTARRVRDAATTGAACRRARRVPGADADDRRGAAPPAAGRARTLHALRRPAASEPGAAAGRHHDEACASGARRRRTTHHVKGWDRSARGWDRAALAAS